MKDKKYGRMTPKDELEIVATLRRWGAGELGSRLTWAAITNQFGFSKTALSTNKDIKEAYDEAKEALGGGLVKSRSAAKAEIADLSQKLEQLTTQLSEMRKQEEKWKARWQRIAFHIRQAGVQVNAVDRPAQGPLPDHNATNQILAPFDKDIPFSGRVG